MQTTKWMSDCMVGCPRYSRLLCQRYTVYERAFVFQLYFTPHSSFPPPHRKKTHTSFFPHSWLHHRPKEQHNLPSPLGTNHTLFPVTKKMGNCCVKDSTLPDEGEILTCALASNFKTPEVDVMELITTQEAASPILSPISVSNTLSDVSLCTTTSVIGSLDAEKSDADISTLQTEVSRQKEQITSKRIEIETLFRAVEAGGINVSRDRSELAALLKRRRVTSCRPFFEIPGETQTHLHKARLLEHKVRALEDTKLCNTEKIVALKRMLATQELRLKTSNTDNGSAASTSPKGEFMSELFSDLDI